MARDTISDALILLSKDEGAFSHRSAAADPGGATKYGVTAATLGAYRGLGRPATPDEVRNLTQAEADEIAVDKYARPIRYDDLPAGVDYMLLNMAYMSGPAQAIRIAQRILGVTVDGEMGKQTLSAIHDQDKVQFIEEYCEAYMKFLRGLKNWSYNSRGWTYRIMGRDPKKQFPDKAGVIGNAVLMFTRTGVERPMVDAQVMSDMGADAKANPSQQKVTASEGGKIGLGGLVAVASGAVASAKEQITASGLMGKIAAVDDAFLYLGVAGLVLGVGTSVYALWNAQRKKAAGEPL